jgi:hypothetical protein
MMGGGGLAVTPPETEAAVAANNIEEANRPEAVASNGNNGKASRKSLPKPDVSLEWADIKVSFRIVGQENPEEYELFPNLDPSAPSGRSLMLQRRLQKRTAAKGVKIW